MGKLTDNSTTIENTLLSVGFLSGALEVMMAPFGDGVCRGLAVPSIHPGRATDALEAELPPAGLEGAPDSCFNWLLTYHVTLILPRREKSYRDVYNVTCPSPGQWS